MCAYVYISHTYDELWTAFVPYIPIIYFSKIKLEVYGLPITNITGMLCNIWSDKNVI